MFTVSLVFGCYRISILMDCFNWESNIDEGNLNLRKKLTQMSLIFFFTEGNMSIIITIYLDYYAYLHL